MGSLRSLVKKMIGIDNSKKVKSIEKIVKSDIKPVQVQKPNLVKVNKNIDNKKFENLKLNKVELDIFTLCPHGDKIWYESVTDKDCLSSDVKYIGQAQFSNYLTIPNQGKVKTLIPHGRSRCRTDEDTGRHGRWRKEEESRHVRRHVNSSRRSSKN